MVWTVVRFALTPERAIAGVIDMSDTAGRKIFEHATRALTKQAFDCDSDGIFGFVESVRARASTEGWQKTGGILQILDLNDPTEIQDLLQLYGTVSLEAINAHALTYVDKPTRNAQNSLMLAIVIRESLSEQGRSKIDLRQRNSPRTESRLDRYSSRSLSENHM